MTDEREDAPLWAGALAYALVALVAVVMLATVAEMVVWAVRLSIEGLVWMISLAWGGGVAL